MATETTHSIYLIRGDLARRFWTPCKSLTFYAHLFVGVLLGGGAGIWFTLHQSGFDIDKLSAAILTYFPALVGAALIDVTQEKQPYLRSFGLIAAGVFLVIFLVATTQLDGRQLALASLGAILGILFWWVANGEKGQFRDVKAENATGGSVTRQLLKFDDKDWKI